MPTPNYPEHEKALAVASQTQAAGEFLDWLHAQGFGIVHRGSRMRCEDNVETLVSKWVDIDTAALEREKLAMLAALRNA